ncbi:hypothetical protein RHGRI_005173 [Rhododendron griersonianum]|uniref:Uncharacterized protein n=1 Tax=Rhododendron griersonianum TaxID=479676 RepID=A0AAV6LEG4_9ERIC|nr:hypothetical protein RHGRI_005173 [Rhododendron griersonianum]
MNIFKKKTSPKDALRTSKREMSVATRGIEREIASLQMEEKKLVAEIKKTAKTGNEASLIVTCPKVTIMRQAATRILARQLVRLRQQITNLQGSRAQIRGVATHTQALYASTSISTGMKGATTAMVAMNKQMAPAKQAKVIREFQKQSAQMDMTIEMMSESIDETLDKDEAEEETEELTNQVLDEIGVDIASQLSSAPKGRIASKKVEAVVPRYVLLDFEAIIYAEQTSHSLLMLTISKRGWPLFDESDGGYIRFSSSQNSSSSSMPFFLYNLFTAKQSVCMMTGNPSLLNSKQLVNKGKLFRNSCEHNGRK